MSIEYLLTALIVILIPGTGVIYTISNGLFHGVKATLFAALGCTLGIIPSLLACVLGLSVLLHSSAVAFEIIRYIGVAYLLYLAWVTYSQSTALSFAKKTKRLSHRQILLRGCLINVLNPKLSIFFMAFLPQFISVADQSPTLQLMTLGIVFMLMTLMVFIVYGLLANHLRQYMDSTNNMARNSQRLFSVCFAAMAVKLAITEK